MTQVAIFTSSIVLFNAYNTNYNLLNYYFYDYDDTVGITV